MQLSHNCISKDIPLHRDFNIYTTVLKKQNRAFKIKSSHPSTAH